jgi:hypothetical protein
MTRQTPIDTVEEMLAYSEGVAAQMIKDMDEEEAILMVRDFVSVLASWQPQIAAVVDDPVMLGVSSLTVAFLFQQCFKKAYLYTNKKVDAIEAIKAAFGESDT